MFLSNKNIALIAIAIILFTYLNVFTGLYFVSALGASLFVLVFVKFIRDIGQTIEVRDLIAFLSILQWVIGPILAYNILPYDELYWMDISEETYMDFVVPGCMTFVIGMYLPISSDRIIGIGEIEKVKEYMIEHPYIGYILGISGLIASFISSYVPESLGFLFKLLGALQFVGVYMILFGNSKFKWLLFAGLLGTVIMASVLQGMFGELMLWLLFSFLIIAIVIKIPIWGKVSLILFGFFVIIIVQSTKEEYRQATWFAESTQSNPEIYKEIIWQRVSNPSIFFGTETLENMGARLNQGWIIARIMGHMPKDYDFVKGETILDGIYAGIVPRIFVPDKVMAGGRANFERFTGTPLPETTSMDISLIGEGYANYGFYGGMVFLLIMGLFYNWIIVTIVKLSKNHPVIILFVPMLFFDVIKAETDFATVFNYLTKSALIVYLVFLGMNKILKIKM